jgi:hypothetical protein
MKRVLLALAGLFSALLLAPTAHADYFDMCPDGHEGVVGGHTSCSFAQNVRSGYFLWGLHFNALSPAMGTWYVVDCDPTIRPAIFTGGASVNSVRCYAGDGAEVVIW